MMKFSSVVALVALGVSGCGVDEIDEPGGLESRSAALVPQDPDCDPLVCPGNSDLIGVLGPYELDEAGTNVSERGFRIVDIKHQGEAVSLFQVLGASIHIQTPTGTFTGPGVVGLQLTLEHQPTLQKYEVVIDQYYSGHVPYYANAAPSSEIDGYYIHYSKAGAGDRKPLCPYAEYVDEGVEGSWAVFWKGDRYNPETGRIFASGAAVGSWFNISCAGEATVKMLRARTGGAVAPASPPAQRQATLNMFTASYCGPTGDRYTMLGQKLAWSDLSGPSQMGPVASHEAIWSETGAVCLDTPRMVKRSHVGCKIDYCTQPMIDNWPLHGWLSSGNRFVVLPPP